MRLELALDIRLLATVSSLTILVMAPLPSSAYDVRANVQARAQYSNFVNDSDQSFDSASSASAETGPVTDGFGGFGQASASSSLWAGSASASVLANNGVGNASAEFTEDLRFSVPAGTALADVEFRIPVTVSLQGDYLSTSGLVVTSAAYRISLNAAGMSSVVASDNVFQTSCGSGFVCDAAPGELWIQGKVADQDLVNLNAIALISSAGSTGIEGGVSISLGSAQVITSNGATWTSQSGTFLEPEPVPLLGPVGLVILSGLVGGGAYRRLCAN